MHKLRIVLINEMINTQTKNQAVRSLGGDMQLENLRIGVRLMWALEMVVQLASLARLIALKNLGFVQGHLVRLMSQDKPKVAAAVSQIAQTNQQNAAMVEKMTDAVRSVSDQMQELMLSVAVLRLSGKAVTSQSPVRQPSA